MPEFSFIHTADLHLDSPFATLSPNNPDLADILRSATFDAYEKIIQTCMERNVDFLLVAGDIYDGADRSLRAQVKFRDGLKRLDNAGIQVFVVHGNHDPLDGWSSTIEWPANVHIFGEHMETLEVRKENNLLACIQGISYPKRDERRNLSLLFNRTGHAFHIGLLHANVGSDTGHEPYAPCTMEDLLKSGMDYWALGHVHREKILSPNHPFVVYSGNTQGRNIRETGEKGCYLVTIHGDQEAEFEFLATDVIQWKKADLPIRGLETEQKLIDALDQVCLDICESESNRPKIVRITLSGHGPLYRFLRRPDASSDLLEILREITMSRSPFVWVEQIQLRAGPEIEPESRMKEKDFLGDLLRISREITSEGHFEEALRKDLAPLFEDAKARRFLDFPGMESLKDLLRQAERICLEGLSGEGSE
jgi:exonuclease SbcD